MSELSEEVGRTIASEADYREPPPSKAKRGRPRKVSAPSAPFVYQPNEASIKACVILSDVVFRIVCRVAKWENVTDEELLEVGQALDRVLQKRLPVMSEWGEEVALGMVLVGVIAPRVMGSGSGATVIDEEEPKKEEEPEKKDGPINYVQTEKDVDKAIPVPEISEKDW